MSQEISEVKNKNVTQEKTIPGPVVVLGVAVFVVAFPLLAIVIERYAKHVGEREGLRPGYSAYRDPQQWLLSWGIIAVCVLLGWGISRALKKR